jgi:hypothetical protein
MVKVGPSTSPFPTLAHPSDERKAALLEANGNAPMPEQYGIGLHPVVGRFA